MMTPQPRLRTGFFSTLEASSIPYLPEACTSAGVAKFGKPVGLDDKLKVDLIVIGSVAVDPSTGARLGKGEVRAYHVHFPNVLLIHGYRIGMGYLKTKDIQTLLS